MNNCRRPIWLSVACAFVLMAMSAAGCKRSPAYQHEPMYWEHPFYGYNATCWQQWPADWVGCPTVCMDPQAAATWEVLPPGSELVPPGAQSPPREHPSDDEMPHPPVPPAGLEQAEPMSANPASQLRSPGQRRISPISRQELQSERNANRKVEHVTPVTRSNVAPFHPEIQRSQTKARSETTPQALAVVLATEPPVDSKLKPAAKVELPVSPAANSAVKLVRPIAFDANSPVLPAHTETHSKPPSESAEHKSARVPRITEIAPLEQAKGEATPRSLAEILDTGAKSEPADDWLDLSRTRDLMRSPRKR